MDQDQESNYGVWNTVHEYPDPDYAAHVTQYPWAGSEYIQPDSLNRYGGTWDAVSSSSSESDRSINSDRQLPEYLDGRAGLRMVPEVFDPDYQTSNDPIP